MATNITELLKNITEAIVDNPDAVVVREVEGEKASILELRVAPEDVGKVIGREGRIINALRTVIKAAAGKDSKRVTIELLS